MLVIAITATDVVGVLAAAVGGGFLGSVVATQMTIRHERREQFRTRMIEAADDVLTITGDIRDAALAARGEVEAVTSSIRRLAEGRAREMPSLQTLQRAQERVATARDLIGGARFRGNRTALLFADETVVAGALNLVQLTALMLQPLQRTINATTETMEGVVELLTADDAAADVARVVPELETLASHLPSFDDFEEHLSRQNDALSAFIAGVRDEVRP